MTSRDKQSLTSFANGLRTSGPRDRILRFLIVGGGTSLGYVSLVALLVDVIGIRAVVSAAFAYLVMLPVSFLAHKLFTFQSRRRTLPESIRFLAMHVLTACICGAVMWFATAVFASSHWIGSAITVVVAPAVNFILLEFWVFRTPRPHDV